MVEELLRLKVIRVSTADIASQVLLVAKKGTSKLRFCIDYRAINEATKSPETWPIPNIKSMLERLGQKKPKFFGVMDLTSGYHQAPLSESAKKWTAFVTAFGQFEWNRVAMGLTGAPSYFQRVMMTTVLGDVLTKAVEVYLDDFIVFGSTKEEFLDHLEQVLLRCVRAGITLNPSKCRFGLELIEYVGHTIDKDGIHFSREKIDSILDMAKPSTKGEMKTFLGMVNYFHSHVAGLSQMETPLTAMIGEGYKIKDRRNGMRWTKEADEAFDRIKAAIDNCPKLFFRDEDYGPVYLQTDASDYGHGAYLFQVNPDGSHRPIDFISRTFPKACKKWHVSDKEAFAIFYAFKRWEHHLRDREFILQTDHQNLCYVNFEGTAKVKRWKMLIQEYRFKIEFLKGEHNQIADSFSRNCPVSRPDEEDDLHVPGNTIEREYLHFLEEVEVLELFEQATEIEDAELAESDERDFLAFIENLDDELHFLDSDESELMLIHTEAPIPNAIYEAIAAAHNTQRGHKGVRRTEGRIRRAGAAMKNMRQWVERFIKECDFCQKQSYRTRKVDVLPFTLAQTQRVMQRLGMDAIGPLDEDEYGFTYVLTVIDSFSRWLMAYPLRKLETKEIVRNLITHVGIFGNPVELLTDNASSLTSKMMGEVIERFNTLHKTTLAYSHQENAITERWNKEIIRYLRAMVYDSNSVANWSELLPFAQRICNAEVCESIGVAPAQIIFGTAIELDRQVLVSNSADKPHIEEDHGAMSEYVADLIEAQRIAIELARKIQKEKDDAHMMSAGVPITDFPIGSLVTAAYPESLGGARRPPAKLLTQRRGPYVVLGRTGNTYHMKHAGDDSLLDWHASGLAEFLFDPTRVDPAVVALKDKRGFLIEAIVAHRPVHKPTKVKKHLEFLVKWKGFDDSQNTWEPWHSLTKNSICHRYCMAHKMKSLVSKAFREQLAAEDAGSEEEEDEDDEEDD